MKGGYLDVQTSAKTVCTGCGGAQVRTGPDMQLATVAQDGGTNPARIAAELAVAHAIEQTEFFEVARAQLNEFAECEVDYDVARRLINAAFKKVECE